MMTGTVKKRKTRPSDSSSFDKDMFQRLLLEWILGCGLSFKILDSPSVHKFFQFISDDIQENPEIFPSAKTMRDTILVKEVHISNIKSNAILSYEKYLTMMFNGSNNLKEEEMAGALFVTPNSDVIIWKLKDTFAVRGAFDTWAAPMIKEFLNEFAIDPKISISSVPELDNNSSSLLESSVYNPHVLTFSEPGDLSIPPLSKIAAVVTDSSAAYAAARQRLRVDPKYQHITWLPCLAHQLYLQVADIFKCFPALKASMKDVQKVIEFFDESPEWLDELRSQQNRIYGESFHLTPGGDNEWSALEGLARAVVKARDALEHCARADNSSKEDLPAMDSVVQSILINPQFYKNLNTLSALLNPISSALDHLETNQTRLYHVIYHFCRIGQLLAAQPLAPEFEELDASEIAQFQKRLEDRWATWEHPLLLLAHSLHPAFRSCKFNVNFGVTRVNLSVWCENYYFLYFQDAPPERMFFDLQDYYQRDGWANDLSWQRAKDYSDPVVSFWECAGNTCPHLSRLALRILSITISSAAMSTFKVIQEQRRKGFGDDLLVGVAQIKNRLCREEKARKRKSRMAKSLHQQPQALLESTTANTDRTSLNAVIQSTDESTGSESSDDCVDEGEDEEMYLKLENWAGILEKWEAEEEDFSEMVETKQLTAFVKGWEVHPANDGSLKYLLCTILHQQPPFPPLSEWAGSV